MQRNPVTVKIHAIITLASLKIMVCTVNVDMPTHFDQIARNWAIRAKTKYSIFHFAGQNFRSQSCIVLEIFLH